MSWTRARCAESSLVDAFQAVFERPVANVLVIGGVDLFLGHEKRPVFGRQQRWGNREVKNITGFEPPIFGISRL